MSNRSGSGLTEASRFAAASNDEDRLALAHRLARDHRVLREETARVLDRRIEAQHFVHKGLEPRAVARTLIRVAVRRRRQQRVADQPGRRVMGLEQEADRRWR